MNRYQSLDDILEVLVHCSGSDQEWFVRHTSNPFYWVHNLRNSEIHSLHSLLKHDSHNSFTVASLWKSPILESDTITLSKASFRMSGNVAYTRVHMQKQPDGLRSYLTCVLNTTGDGMYYDDIKNIPTTSWHQIIAHEPLSTLCTGIIPLNANISIEGYIISTWQLTLDHDPDLHPTIMATTTLIAQHITIHDSVQVWQRST